MSSALFVVTSESTFRIYEWNIEPIARSLLGDKDFMSRVEGAWDGVGNAVELLKACLGALNLKAYFASEGDEGDLIGVAHLEPEVPYGHATWMRGVLRKHFLPHVVTGSFLRVVFDDEGCVYDWVFEDDGHCGFLWGDPQPVLREYDVKLVRDYPAVEDDDEV